MANKDRPRGFTAKGQLLRMNPYDFSEGGDGTGATTLAIFRGDMVEAAADGEIEAATAGSIKIIGASMTHHVASTATTAANQVLVLDNPHQLYEVQDDGTEDPPGRDEAFQGCDHVAGTGSAKTLLSGHELNLTNGGVSTGGFKILGAIEREDNDPDLVNADWVVQLNIGEGLLTVAGGI